MKKKIIFISGGRSDFDRFSSVLKEINNKKNVELSIFLSSPYFNKFFNYDLKKIKKKFKILNIEKKLNYFDDTPFQMVKNLINDMTELSKIVKKIKPNLIIVIGDRYEMLVGPIVAIPNNIPLIHFFGGAVTEGAIDEQIRHAITKMSHFHFTLIKDYESRLKKLGEESWRIKTIGMPNLNAYYDRNFKNLKELSNEINFDLKKPYMLVTFHPVTLSLKNISDQINTIIKAVKLSGLNSIISYPNSDVKFNFIIKLLKKNFDKSEKVLITSELGESTYLNLMKNSVLILGNSSSGIVEASTFKVPVVNIGDRQKGKVFPKNVINVNYELKNILAALKKAKSEKFKNKLKNITNPYNSKISVKKIADFIVNLKLNNKLLKKRFID